MKLHTILIYAAPLWTWASCDNSSTSSCSDDASLLLQLGGTATKISSGGDYVKQSGAYCPNHDEFRTYPSMSSAQQACDKDAGCAGLYDYGCGGSSFYLCFAPLQTFSSGSSCVHVKNSSPSSSSRRRRTKSKKSSNRRRRRRRRRRRPDQTTSTTVDPYETKTCATYTCPWGWATRNPQSTRLSQWECCQQATCATYTCPAGWTTKNEHSTRLSRWECCQEATCATYACPAGWTTKNEHSTRLSQWECCQEATCATYACPAGWTTKNQYSTRLSQSECCQEPAPSQWKADGSKNHCRPIVNGRVQGPHIRKRLEVNLWSDAKWAVLNSAVQKFKTVRGGNLQSYDDFASIHIKGHRHHNKQVAKLQFLPWHRNMLLHVETRLQVLANDCDLTLPYWNSNLDGTQGSIYNARVFDPDRVGGRPYSSSRRCNRNQERRCITDGLADGWNVRDGANLADGCSCVHRSYNPRASLPNFATILSFVQRTQDFSRFNNEMDNIHAAVHCDVMGKKSDMCLLELASNDPIFYLHHAYIDRLWHYWQRYHSIKYGRNTWSCWDCDQNMGFFNTPMNEMFGTYDHSNECIAYPKSDPTVCVSYEGRFKPTFALTSFLQQSSKQGRGQRVFRSSNCEEVVALLEEGALTADAMKKAVVSTRPLPKKEMMWSCLEWGKWVGKAMAYNHTNEGAEAAEHDYDASCNQSLHDLEEIDDGMAKAKASTKEEHEFGFKCEADWILDDVKEEYEDGWGARRRSQAKP